MLLKSFAHYYILCAQEYREYILLHTSDFF